MLGGLLTGHMFAFCCALVGLVLLIQGKRIRIVQFWFILNECNFLINVMIYNRGITICRQLFGHLAHPSCDS